MNRVLPAILGGVMVLSVASVVPAQAHHNDAQQNTRLTNIENRVALLENWKATATTQLNNHETRIDSLEAGGGGGGASTFPAVFPEQFGAVGDSNHNLGGGTNDTTAIQLAYEEANISTALVGFMGGKTYRITSTIEVCPDFGPPMHTVGYGGQGFNKVVMLPNIVWDGPAGGTMFQCQSSGANIPGVSFTDVRFAGRGIANTAITYKPTSTNAAKLDTGSYLENVHFGAFAGDAVRIETLGTTNFYIHGGRWDAVQGYALYAKVSSQTHLSVRDVTWDVGTSGKGFAWFDGGPNTPEGTNNTHYVEANFDSGHFESGGLVDTVPAAPDEASKSGIIRCTIESAEIIVQCKITMTSSQILGWNSTDASHSLIQMDGGASNDERKARLNFSGRNVYGFNGDGSAALGHVIPFGNMGLTNPSPGNEYQELSHRFCGGGVIANACPRVWNSTG
jgi:hypothetical protein